MHRCITYVRSLSTTVVLAAAATVAVAAAAAAAAAAATVKQIWCAYMPGRYLHTPAVISVKSLVLHVTYTTSNVLPATACHLHCRPPPLAACLPGCL